ncbi:MAG: hypothetical protein QOJ19_2548, partial [Acidimicrobiia bacterium]|nr:hypothetical protein [Acidimicrobiia bacterium]
YPGGQLASDDLAGVGLQQWDVVSEFAAM